MRVRRLGRTRCSRSTRRTSRSRFAGTAPTGSRSIPRAIHDHHDALLRPAKYGQGAAYVIDSGRSYRFTGTDLREDRRGDMPRYDDFDRWSNERDHRYDNSVSGRYVSPDMIGYQDLDANGTWRIDATYGNV